MEPRLQERWRHFQQIRDPASLRMVAGLVLVSTLLGLFLIAGPHPWESSITKRLASGKPLKLEQFITTGLWWGALTGLLATLIGLGTVKWWSRPQVPVFPDLHAPSLKAVRWTWFFALIAMLLAIWPRWSRMDHSLWNDEEYHWRTYAWGTMKPDADGKPKFDAITWSEALFLNEKGNHHPLASVESRLGHALTGHHWGPESTFSERGLRIFPFISGILTVGILVLLGAALSGPRAGLAAGLILALHPWHVRWSVEIRGYSTMLCAVTAGLYFQLRAFQTNQWRWWLGYALTQFLCLASFPGIVYVVAAQNLVGLAVIAWSPLPRSVRLGSASRLITAGICAFVPTALLYGPHVPQLAAYLSASHEYALIGSSWFMDLWSHLVTGLRPGSDPAGSSAGICLDDLLGAAPWKSWIFFGLVPVIAAGGLIALLKQDWRTRFVSGSLLLAGLLAIGHNIRSGSPFLTWYLLYLLPLFSLSLVQAAVLISKWRPRSLASLPLITAVLFSLFTSPALERMMHVPRQPIREAVAAMRGVAPALSNADSHVLTASIGTSARQMLSYDPGLHILETLPELNLLTEKALVGKQPLFLCVRGPAAVALENPELLAAVTSDPRWQALPPVLGMEALLSYDLYRFAPDTMESIRLQPKP